MPKLFLPVRVTMPEPAWIRYPFAVAVAVLAAVVKLVVETQTGIPAAFLGAIAAVMASAAWAGVGPGIVCTLLLVGYFGLDLAATYPDLSSSAALASRVFAFAVEGLIISWGSGRIRRTMREAAEGEAWHRQLVETAAEGIWIREVSGLIVYANARMAEMLGTTVGALTGHKVEEFFFPADYSVERIRAETLTSGIREQFDRRLRRADGSELWVLACCNLLEDGHRSPPSILAMMTDITERKSAEHALRRSEERYRNLFEGVLEGVYQSTPDGRILAANPMLLKMLGLSNEGELNQVNITRDLYVDPAMRERLLDRLDREGSFQNVEYELRTRDGRVISVLENARVIRDEAGNPDYYEGTLADITSRKRIEEQLRQAQKVEALGRLASGIAQDFSGILNVVAGHAQTALLALPASHPARPGVEQALQATANASALTSQLLSFSRRPADGDSAPATGSSIAAAPGQILLVDDEPLVRELSRQLLEQRGYRVTCATDGDEAVRLSGRGVPFDLMITDLTMPAMRGSELAKRIRSVRPEMKVLFISGYTDPPPEHDEMSGEGTEFLQKPFSADSLSRKIDQMLAR